MKICQFLKIFEVLEAASTTLWACSSSPSLGARGTSGKSLLLEGLLKGFQNEKIDQEDWNSQAKVISRELLDFQSVWKLEHFLGPHEEEVGWEEHYEVRHEAGERYKDIPASPPIYASLLAQPDPTILGHEFGAQSEGHHVSLVMTI